MKILVILATLILTNELKAVEVDTIVSAHTLKETAKYQNDLSFNPKDELLFIWVGSIDLELYEKLKNERNTFIQELPGTKMGLLVAKGQSLQEIFEANALLNAEIVKKIKKTYLTKEISSEQKLLIVESPYPARNLVPKKLIESKAQDLTQPGMHKHQCEACGTVWAHRPGGSHFCPNCGKGEWLTQYQGPKPATFIH